MRESPVRPKLSRQISSQPHRQTRQRASEAGDGRSTGSVLSPEMGTVVVLLDKLPGSRRVAVPDATWLFDAFPVFFAGMAGAASGKWDQVSFCDAFPGTVFT